MTSCLTDGWEYPSWLCRTHLQMNIFIKVLGGRGSRLIFQEKLIFPGSQDLEHPILVIIYKVTTPLWEYVIVTPVYNSGDTDGNPPSLLYEPKTFLACELQTSPDWQFPDPTQLPRTYVIYFYHLVVNVRPLQLYLCYF